MSWGYVPKKLKYARRRRHVRKKWKNFSCETCLHRNDWCWVKTWNGNQKRQFCERWKADHKAKYSPKTNPAQTKEKKSTFAQRIKSIFK